MENTPDFYMKHISLALKSKSIKNNYKTFEELSKYTRDLIERSNLEKMLNLVLEDPKKFEKFTYEGEFTELEDCQILDSLLTFLLLTSINVGKITNVNGLANAIMEERPGLIKLMLNEEIN